MVDQTEGTIGANLRGGQSYVDTPDIDVTLPEIEGAGINPLTGQPYITPNTEVMGAGTPEPYTPDIPVERTPASKISSFSAGVGSMTREYYRGALETFMFEPDPQYNKDADLAKFEKTMGLRDGELEQFQRAKSPEQFQHIVDTVLGNRDRDERMGDNFWSGLAGSFLDIDTFAGALGGGVGAAAGITGKLNRVSRAAIAAGAAASTTAGAVVLGGDNTSLDDTDHVINVVSAGLGGWFATTSMRDLDAAIDAERAAVRGTEPTGTPTGTTAPTEAPTQRALPDEQPVTPRAPFSDYATKAQENKGKRTLRVIEDAPDSRFQAKYRYTDDGLTVESVQVQKGLDDKRIRMDAYEYGIRLANEQGVPFKVNPNEKQVIKSLQGLGYNVQDGIVQGTKTFDGSSIRTATSTQAAKVELTSEQVQNLANEVLPEVLKVDDEIASIPLDNVAGVPKGVYIPLSQPLVDKNGNQLMPKGSIERMWQAQAQSAYDLLIHYTKDPNNPLMKLLASPYNAGDDAPSAASALQRRGDTMLAEVELALNEATKELHGTSSVWGRLGAKSHTEAFKQTSMDMYEALQRLDQHVIEQASNGTVLSQDDIIKLVDNLTYPEPIKKAVRTYLNSGFAAFHHSNLGRGVVDEDTIGAILQRSTYAPVAHNYERIRTFINRGADDAAKAERELRVQQFLGNQIADMYQGLRNGIKTSKGVVRMTPADLGKRFLKNAEVRARSPNTIRTLGVPRDDVVDMLVDQGVPLDEAKQLAVTITDYSAKQRGFSNTRRRISWDWNARMPMPDGSTFGMRDLVDDNPVAVLQDYNRRVSKRTALAKYGFGNREALETAKHEMLNALPEGVDKAKATKFIDDTISAALGNPVGESLPMTVRSLQTVAGGMLLAWSGLYQGVEAATQVVKLGVVRNFPHILKAGKPVFKGMKGYTVSEAKTVEKALTGMLISPDRWRNIFTHLSDDFDVTSKFHESVQYFGQSTKFLNASEFVKRWQIGAYASVVTKAFEGTVKGSASDLKFLRNKLRMSDELIDAIKTEYKANGDNINAWDVDTRLAMEQKVLHEGDNVALQIHHGEVPDFLEYTAWGKMIFPFMRFVWGAHNKLLRGTYIRDGVLGVAMVLAVQIPLAMAVAQLKQMSAGKEPFDMDKPEDVKEWVRSTVTAMSGLGIFSIPMDVILSEGRNIGSVSVFAPVTKTYGLVSALASEDGASVRDFKENTLLNTPLPMSLLMIAFEEDE